MLGKAQASAPTWGDVKAAFPEVQFVDTPDGKRTCRIEDHTPGKRRLRLLNEMFRPKNRIEAEVGQNRHARTPEVQMRDPSGHIRYVREDMEERAVNKFGSRKVHRGRSSYTVWYDRNGDEWVKLRHGDWKKTNG